MGQHFSKDEVDEIVRLHEVEGMTHKQIAEKMGRMDKKGAPNARSIMEQYSKFKRFQSLEKQVEGLSQSAEVEAIVPMVQEEVPPLLPMNIPLEPKSDSPQVARFAGESKTMTVPEQRQEYVFKEADLNIQEDAINLSDMTSNQRYEFLRKHIFKSTRGKHTFNKILNKEETDLFCEEYFRILKEQDSLTNAEEQGLFTAILNYVLYHRALELDKEAREKFERGVPGTVYDTRWQKEYNDRYVQYIKGIEALKLSRQQRLKDLARSGNTFLDIAEQLMKKDNQNALADEIMRIEHANAEELKRLQENGWMIFGGAPNNNPETNYFNTDTDDVE